MARRTKEDADETRNRLLDAAEQVFYEKGLSRASLAEIAQAAGATRGAIYWHFKDKVDLFNAMMDRVTLSLDEACSQDVCAEDPLQGLRALVAELFRSIESDRRARRVFEIAMHRVEYVAEAMDLRGRRQAARARFAAVLMRDLGAASRVSGVRLQMPLAVAAAGVQALFDGLLQSWILEDGGFGLQASGIEVLDAYLRGLGFGV